MSFRLIHITKEYNQLRPKWFLSLWYVRQKLCSYLAPRLTLSPNGPKQASTWHTLPRSTIRCAQKPFPWPWYIQRKPCTYLASRLKLSPNGLKRAFAWSTLPRSTIRCIQNDVKVYGTLGASHAPILHQDWHYPQTDQNDFRAYGTFSTNRAPNLCLA
jgi:hypothetical protein